MCSGITATVKNKTDGVVTTASVRITQPKESENVCPQHAKSYICGLGRGDAESPLCEHHDVFIQRTNTGKYVTKVKEYKHIIEKPTYNSLDQAAMAAANIIVYYVNKDGDVDKNSIESIGYIDKNYIAKDDNKKISRNTVILNMV